MSLLGPLSTVTRVVATKSTSSVVRPSSTLLFTTAANATKNNTPSSANNNNYYNIMHPSSITTAVTYRSKHSATQVKRLFLNPKRLRILTKEGWTPKEPTIPQITYKPIFQPTFLSNGWSAPPGPEVNIPEYPFKVQRTGRKPFGSVGFLPVYRDVRVHGTKHTTIIRKITGDIPAFINELRAVLQLGLGKKGILTSASTGAHGGGEAGRGVTVDNPIRIRTGGVIEVYGDYAKDVKLWLAGLGF